MVDRFTLSPFEFFVMRTRTRFPFRYGIASMTDVPHLFVRTRVSSAGNFSAGLTAEGLPPKWFTKNPATTFEQDLPELLESIGHATDIAEAAASDPISFFDLWRNLERLQNEWASSRGVPTLVAGLGVALVERAVLDGLCRLTAEPIHKMLAAGRLVAQRELQPVVGSLQAGILQRALKAAGVAAQQIEGVGTIRNQS